MALQGLHCEYVALKVTHSFPSCTRRSQLRGWGTQTGARRLRRTVQQYGPLQAVLFPASVPPHWA